MPPVRRYLDRLVDKVFAPLTERSGPHFRVLGVDSEQGLQIFVEHHGRVLLIELEERNDELDCRARTARFNVSARRQFDAGAELDAADRRLVDAVVELVRRREHILPDVPRPTTARSTSLREILVDRMLVPEGDGHYYLNPYVGCMIGCEFCYVMERADLSRRLEGLPAMPWGRWVDVKINAADVLARELESHPPGIVRMGPILTDPYQGPERRYRITRQCLEVMLGTGFTPAVLTRAARVLEDLDLLARFEGAAVGFSIPSDDDRMRAFFEPGADPIEARVDALKKCHERGLTTMVLVQPMLPMNPEALVESLAPYVDGVRIDRMHRMDLMAPRYAERGLEWAATDDFFAETEGRLREGFRSQGVRVDDLDDLARMIDRPGDA
jgi:DNA repair photolyase